MPFLGSGLSPRKAYCETVCDIGHDVNHNVNVRNEDVIGRQPLSTPSQPGLGHRRERGMYRSTADGSEGGVNLEVTVKQGESSMPTQRGMASLTVDEFEAGPSSQVNTGYGNTNGNNNDLIDFSNETGNGVASELPYSPQNIINQSYRLRRADLATRNQQPQAYRGPSISSQAGPSNIPTEILSSNEDRARLHSMELQAVVERAMALLMARRHQSVEDTIEDSSPEGEATQSTSEGGDEDEANIVPDPTTRYQSPSYDADASSNAESSVQTESATQAKNFSHMSYTELLAYSAERSRQYTTELEATVAQAMADLQARIAAGFVTNSQACMDRRAEKKRLAREAAADAAAAAGENATPDSMPVEASGGEQEQEESEDEDEEDEEDEDEESDMEEYDFESEGEDEGEGEYEGEEEEEEEEEDDEDDRHAVEETQTPPSPSAGPDYTSASIRAAIFRQQFVQPVLEEFGVSDEADLPSQTVMQMHERTKLLNTDKHFLLFGARSSDVAHVRRPCCPTGREGLVRKVWGEYIIWTRPARGYEGKPDVWDREDIKRMMRENRGL